MCMVPTNGVEGTFLNDRRDIQFDHMNRDCLTGKLVSLILS